ncbi:MAG: hypothetical protein NTY09_00395 [bacterium]|nr:hypothetical protein [bacterium]
MVHALRKKVTVKPGGIVELRSRELVPGSIVEVIVIQEKQSPKGIDLTRLIGVGRGIFSTVEEVDEFIQGERDSWDR